MNYQKHYNALIEKARNRKIDDNIYTECHHILPKSMGGTNSLENLVDLTPREHFIAHYLLWKIHKNFSMGKAFLMMSDTRKHKQRITSYQYESVRLKVNKLSIEKMNDPKVKEYLRQINLGHPVSNETRNKISNALSGRKQPEWLVEKRKISNRTYMQNHRFGKTWEEIYGEETAENMRQKISLANTGKILTEVHKENIRKGNVGKKLSNETKEKISASNKGKIRTEETRKQLSKSHLGKTLTEEQKKKISISHQGRKKSEETKKRISASKKGKKFSEEHKQKLREAAKNRKKKFD